MNHVIFQQWLAAIISWNAQLMSNLARNFKQRCMRHKSGCLVEIQSSRLSISFWSVLETPLEGFYEAIRNSPIGFLREWNQLSQCRVQAELSSSAAKPDNADRSEGGLLWSSELLFHCEYEGNKQSPRRQLHSPWFASNSERGQRPRSWRRDGKDS